MLGQAICNRVFVGKSYVKRGGNVFCRLVWENNDTRSVLVSIKRGSCENNNCEKVKWTLLYCN